ncbi:MAG: type II toxin-antitoxin system HicB family antitoxin [Vulcanimicrobiaceae bacterium]
MSYLAIVERVNRSWNAYVPDLPGCVAVAGTRARVEELIREAVPRHVALLRSRGETVPEPSSQTIEIAIA